MRGLVKGFIPNCANDSRAIELRQAIAVADARDIWRCPSMFMLATVEVLELGARGPTVIAEIDGLVGYFDENGGLRWMIVETKKRCSANGEKQLRKNLCPALACDVGTIERLRHGDQDVWHFEISSPSMLAR